MIQLLDCHWRVTHFLCRTPPRYDYYEQEIMNNGLGGMGRKEWTLLEYLKQKRTYSANWVDFRFITHAWFQLYGKRFVCSDRYRHGSKKYPTIRLSRRLMLSPFPHRCQSGWKRPKAHSINAERICTCTRNYTETFFRNGYSGKMFYISCWLFPLNHSIYLSNLKWVFRLCYFFSSSSLLLLLLLYFFGCLGVNIYINIHYPGVGHAFFAKFSQILQALSMAIWIVPMGKFECTTMKWMC